MSRVHLEYAVNKDDDSRLILDVMSPDFSNRGTERELIGRLHIDYIAGSFKFMIEDELASEFCPPEYFEKYSGNIERTEDACKKSNLRCTAWSYRIYRKAKEMLERKTDP